MDRYFKFDDQLLPFLFYSPAHTLSLLIILAVCVLILIYKPLRNKKNADRIRHLLAGVLLLFDIALNLWYVSAEQWDIAQTLPLHLCSLTLLLSIIMLWTKSYRLFEFVYFAGIGGALQALLTPAAILSGFPHFTFYYFFVAHGGIIAACLLMVAGYKFRPTLSSIARTMLYLNILLIPIFLINRWTGGNYMFIARKPSDPSLIDLLGPWPYYIVSMELVALIIFFLLYLPFLLRRSIS
jgi:hypothetical integral membrane protein (TIGR02206 family)